jgi:hypothetical protein
MTSFARSALPVAAIARRRRRRCLQSPPLCRRLCSSSADARSPRRLSTLDPPPRPPRPRMDGPRPTRPTRTRAGRHRLTPRPSSSTPRRPLSPSGTRPPPPSRPSCPAGCVHVQCRVETGRARLPLIRPRAQQAPPVPARRPAPALPKRPPPKLVKKGTSRALEDIAPQYASPVPAAATAAPAAAAIPASGSDDIAANPLFSEPLPAGWKRYFTPEGARRRAAGTQARSHTASPVTARQATRTMCRRMARATGRSRTTREARIPATLL